MGEVAEPFVLHEPMEAGEPSSRLSQTAALIRCLDLVITADTSTAHLAGALGATTWIVLRQACDWRWMLDRQDSPWYPTARLYRQPKPADWSGVFEEMARNLKSKQLHGQGAVE